MTPPAVLEHVRPSPDAVVAEPELRLHLEDILAVGRRLWVRGEVATLPDPAPVATNGSLRLWGSNDKAPVALTATLELQVDGLTLTTETTIDAAGRFEARLDSDATPPWRGWRVAEVTLHLGEQIHRASGVVLHLPRRARQAVFVLLPRGWTSTAKNVQGLNQSRDAKSLGSLVEQLQRQAGPAAPVYYLAGVSPPQRPSPAELALAVAGLGWPRGHFLQLPAEAEETENALDTALDRLRWLCADTAEVVILNLEPAATGLLSAHREARPDRAAVARIVSPLDEASKPECLPNTTARQRALVRTRRGALVTRHPIVFCHGMLALSTLKGQVPEDLNCFRPLQELLRSRGYHVFFPQVAPTSGVQERAEQLRDQIRHWTDEPVNIIAHSMGGLDARCMITQLDMAARVKSLTTVATPHRGTYLAEWFQEMYRRRVPILPAMEAMGINMDGVRDCQRHACAAFNRETPNVPAVRYFSFGGAVTPARVTPALRRGLSLLLPIEGPNDGLVSLSSACWGEYLGTLQADHYAQTPDSVFVRAGEDFDSPAFYSRLVEDLARRGF